MNFTNLFSEETVSALSDITFKRVLPNLEDEQELKILSKDHIAVAAADENSLTLCLTREISFEPDSIFNLSVSFEIVHFVKKEHIGKAEWNKYNILNEVKKNSNFYFSGLLEKVSLAVSQITLLFGIPPVVTPPVLLISDE